MGTLDANAEPELLDQPTEEINVEPEVINLVEDEDARKKIMRLYHEHGIRACCQKPFDTKSEVKDHLLAIHHIRVDEENPGDEIFVLPEEDEDMSQKSTKDDKKRPKKSKEIKCDNCYDGP